MFEGSVDDYLYKLSELEKEGSQPSGANEGVGTAGLSGKENNSEKPKGKAARQKQARVRQEKSKQLMPLKKIVSEAEAEITLLESRKNELEQQMADPELYKNEEDFAQCSREYKALERRLERQYMRWETAQGHVEEK